MSLRKKVIAGTVVAAVLLSTLAPAFAEQRDSFTDIPQGAWYASSANVCAELGLVSGSTFKPQDPITIGDALYAVSGIRNLNPYFSYDQPQSTFIDASKPATRAEFAHILAEGLPENKCATLRKVELKDIPDVDENTPYSEDILKLYQLNILHGMDNTEAFSPNNTLTRAEAFVFIQDVANIMRPKVVYVTPITENGQTVIPSDGINKIYENGVYERIFVKYGAHNYGCNNQKEYDAVMNKIESIRIQAERDAKRNNIEDVLDKLEAYKGGKRFDSKTNASIEKAWVRTGLINGSRKEMRARLISSIMWADVFADNSPNNNGESAYTAIMEKRGDCNALASAKQAMFDSLGLNTRIMKNTTHAWCEVEIGGQWYHTDGGLEISSTNGTVLSAETFSGRP